MANATRILALSLGATTTACPAPPRGPSSQPPLAGQTLEIGRAGWELAGVAGDGTTVFAALTANPTGAPMAGAGSPPGRTAVSSGAAPDAAAPMTTIEGFGAAWRADAPVWRTELAGAGGPLAVAAGELVAAVTGRGTVAGIALRGEPGAVLAAFDAATGAPAWKLAVDATEWAVVSSLAAAPDGVILGGSFAGTLRIGERVVSSAGRSDGFVARLTAAGAVAWLIRIGGPGADAVEGVAASADRVAVAGTFAAGAELLGQPLGAIEDRSPAADGFVAELDAQGARRWAQSFGGPADDPVAGVAIDARGRVAVAAGARETVHLAGRDLVASGPADGLVAWWDDQGAPGAQVLLGGAEFDGLGAIASAGERVVVAGFYSGSIRLGDRALTAGGGGDAFLAELDATGRVVTAWPIDGEGREEVTALAAIPGGFVAGIAHTAAARIGDDPVPSPRDPLSGAAIIVRGIR
jgi:hypothetical protein